MNQFVRDHKRQFILGGVIVLLFVGFKVMGSDLLKDGLLEAENAETSATEPEITEREASLVEFGEWSPTEVRTVLGQVNSDSDIEVKAELNGTIARVNVAVGDKVRVGQVLASFKTAGDPSAINYQSALSNLETTQLSSQNSVRSAEISVENARKSLAQTISQQEQNYQQAYEALRLESENVKTLITSAIETIDKHVQFSSKYSYNQDLAYTQIGNTDVVRRQNVKNQGQQVALLANALQPVPVGASESEIVRDANTRLQILKTLQTVFDDLEILIERTAINSRISEAQVANFLATVEGAHNAIDSKVGAYQGSIDRAKSAREQTRQAILSAQNAVESAEASLELAQSQAEAQRVGAQNQVNIASASTADLVVRAPISGTITDKSVRVGDLVNPGTPLFNIVNETQDKKVIAYLNQDERLQAQTAEKIEVEINGALVPVTNRFISVQIDPQTQKSLAEFTVPASATLVGNLATVRIPIGSTANGKSNLIPFSSVSFEPDGAEVLVLNEENIAERQKIVVGRVVVSNIEVVSGIELGEEVIEYYKRVLPGERVLTRSEKTSPDSSAANPDNLTFGEVNPSGQTTDINSDVTNE